MHIIRIFYTFDPWVLCNDNANIYAICSILHRKHYICAFCQRIHYAIGTTLQYFTFLFFVSLCLAMVDILERKLSAPVFIRFHLKRRSIVMFSLHLRSTQNGREPYKKHFIRRQRLISNCSLISEKNTCFALLNTSWCWQSSFSSDPHVLFYGFWLPLLYLQTPVTIVDLVSRTARYFHVY